MLKIILLISFFYFIFTHAKLRDVPDFIYLENYNYEIPNEYKEEFENRLKSEKEALVKLWVINFETIGLCDLKFRVANRNEVEDFNRKVKPTIISYESLHGKATIAEHTDVIQHESEDISNVKEKILKIVNKFLFARPVDPDSQISEMEVANNEPTLTLYFKGPYTCLTLKSVINQWHFFIPPPSPLPNWFYQDHTNTIKSDHGMYVEVPEMIENELYAALLSLLPNFLNILFKH